MQRKKETRIGLINGNFEIVGESQKITPAGNRYYLIRCNLCSHVYEAVYSGFSKRKSKSCDNCRFVKPFENRRYNDWQVFNAAYVLDGNHNFFAICLRCNTTRVVSIVNIRNGTSKSCCGNYIADRGGLRIYYKRMKYFATKQRNKEFSLNLEEFEELVTKNCSYCGRRPYNTVNRKYNNEVYKFSGIDRINNNLGYVKGNCVPCCFQCNASKFNNSEDEFYAYIQRAYNNLKRKFNYDDK